MLPWLWLVPIPFGLFAELLMDQPAIVLLGNAVGGLVAAPVLISAQRRCVLAPFRREGAGGTPLLSIAVAVLLAGHILVVAGDGFGLTLLWVSMVAAAMLARAFAGRGLLVLLVVLDLATVIVPGLSGPDGLTFAFGAATMMIAATSFGLLMRMFDRSLVERRDTAVEVERRRIATELHDLVAHEVTGIVVLSQAAARSEDIALLRTALGRIEESAQQALDEIRTLVTPTSAGPGRRAPVACGPQALLDRIDGFCASGGTHIRFRNGLGPLAEEVPTLAWPVLDRVLVEALTNVRRHAGIDVEVSVDLRVVAGDTIVLGIGNAPGTAGIGTGGGTGLHGLRERLRHLGGSLSAGPRTDGGWHLEARIPWRPSPAPTHPSGGLP